MNWGLFRSLMYRSQVQDVIAERAQRERERKRDELYRARARAYGAEEADRMERRDAIAEIQNQQQAREQYIDQELNRILGQGERLVSPRDVQG